MEGPSSSATTWGYLYSTSDAGRTWGRLGSGSFSGPVSFVTDGDGFALTGPQPGGLEVTHDAGESWAPVELALPPGETGAVYDDALPVAVAGGDLVLPAIVGGETDQGFVSSTLAFYTATDLGVTWQLAGTLSDPTFGQDSGDVAVAVVDARTWFVVSPAGGVHETIDGGLSWTTVATVPDLHGVVEASFGSPTVGWALVAGHGCTGNKAGCSTWSEVFRTIDGGRTWSAVPLPSP